MGVFDSYLAGFCGETELKPWNSARCRPSESRCDCRFRRARRRQGDFPGSLAPFAPAGGSPPPADTATVSDLYVFRWIVRTYGGDLRESRGLACGCFEIELDRLNGVK